MKAGLCPGEQRKVHGAESQGCTGTAGQNAGVIARDSGATECWESSSLTELLSLGTAPTARDSGWGLQRGHLYHSGSEMDIPVEGEFFQMKWAGLLGLCPRSVCCGRSCVSRCPGGLGLPGQPGLHLLLAPAEPNGLHLPQTPSWCLLVFMAKLFQPCSRL